MSLLLSNRSTPLAYNGDALPTRIHIVPRGELFNQEANVTQILDDKAIDSILADLKSKAHAGGLYMGEEHFIYDADKSSEAFAWGKQFGADAQGIWVENPDYTDVGGAAIKNKRFKWTSFVTDPTQTDAVEEIAPNKFRILKIDTVGFTNFANGKALLTPISNRLVPLTHHASRLTNLAAPSGSALNRNAEFIPLPANQNQGTNPMKSIALKLGLAADTSDETILDEVARLQNRAVTAEKQVTALTTERDHIKNRCTSLEGEICESLLDACGIKTDDRRRPHLIGGLKPLANRDARITHLADFGLKPLERGNHSAPARILNRAEGKTPVTADSTDEEALSAKATRIKNRANELVASGTPFERAWNLATAEINPKP